MGLGLSLSRGPYGSALKDQNIRVPTTIKLNVGSGPRVADGWLSLDGSWQVYFAKRPRLAAFARVISGHKVGTWPKTIVYANIRKRLAYPDGSIDAVYASHVIEHLYRDEALAFLRDAKRVLKIGGICRIVVPDVKAIVGWYLQHKTENKREASSDVLMDMMCVSTRARRSGGILLRLCRAWNDIDLHKWMYDAEGLQTLCIEAGFHRPVVKGCCESEIPGIDLVEKPERIMNGAGICVEAVKEH